MKRVLSLILAFVFVIGICASSPITIKANAASVDALTFELNDAGNAYQMTSCFDGAKGDIVIPGTYNGLPVTEIASEAFWFCVSLTSITIPESVTSIGDYAFSYCRSLESITIPNSVTCIGEEAFYECNSLKSVTIPDGVECIEDYTFFNCTSLTDIAIPDSVTYIGDYAFSDCTSLKSVILPDGVTIIGVHAFVGCNNLTSITIPDSLTCIPYGVFYDCESLKSVEIPESVTDIGQYAFSYKYDYLEEKIVKIDGFTIYGVKGSAAETYATENGFTFIEINGSDDHAHKYTEEITQQPTCTVEGTKTFTCSCGDTYTETIKATGHKWNNGSVTTEPTCTTQGEKTYVCTVCYDAKSELIPATGHKEVVIPAVAPTFTTIGKTEGKKCSVCGTVTVAQKDVAKLTLATPVVTVKNSSTGVKVTWKAIDGAESYKVYRKTYNTKTKKYGDWKGCATVETTSYVDTKAKSGTKYKYTVKALNGDVKSGIKSSSTILFLAQPTVKIANNASGVKVKWNKITGATGYKVYRSEYANGKWSGWKSVKTITKGSTVSWTDTKAKSGVKYKYTVKAVNGKTGSTYKSSSSLLYLAQPKTTVKAVSNGVKVTWTQITGATSYKIYRSEYNTKTKKWSSWKSVKTAKPTSKSYTDKSAKKGVKYRYAVKAVNGKVASAYKASSSVKR